MKLFSAVTILLTAVLSSVALAASAISGKTLVVYDPKLSNIDNFSTWLQQLEQLGLDVSVTESTSEASLFQNGVRVFQNVIVLPAKQRTLCHDITGASLLAFFNDGGDVFTVTSPEGVSEAVRTFTNELGIYPSPKQHMIVDHFAFDKELGAEEHNVLNLEGENFLNDIVLSSAKKLTYQGSAALLSNNPLLVPLVQAPTTAFTKTTKEDDSVSTWAVGKQAFLSAGLQGLNNARAVWLGDEKALSNDFFAANSEFIDDVSKWTFQMKNIIKATPITHSHVDGTSYEAVQYKVKDDVQVTIGLQEWDGAEWVPYFAEDIQLDVKLLDPYHRLNMTLLSSTKDAALYQAVFPLPDRHGMFSFHIDYKRSGLSYVDEKVILAIRHLANDEYPRSWEITNSWVYITSAIVVFAGWFVFLMAFIYGKDSQGEAKKEK